MWIFPIDNALKWGYNIPRRDEKRSYTMSEDEIRRNVEEAADTAKQDSDVLYGYYLIFRCPSPGAMPAGSVASVSFDHRTLYEEVGERVWGWVGYSRALTDDELSDYELIPDEHNPVRYTQYGVEVRVMTRDSTGKRQITTDWIKRADSTTYTTSYRNKAMEIADSLNDTALDTNSKDRITKATVVKIQGS